MPDWLNIAVAVTVILAAICTALGFSAKYLLLPWLKDNLITPVKKTHHTVTTNHHTSQEPTLLDRISEVRSELAAVREDQAGLIRSTATNTRGIEDLKQQFEQHIANGDV